MTIGALKLMLLSAVGFWLPDTLVHALRTYKFNSSDVTVISVAMPLSLLLTLGLSKRVLEADPLKHIGVIIAGIWLFGGLFMMLGASFSGGGFSSPQGVRWAVTSTALSLFPLYTFILATYDGALGALLLVTAVAAIVWAIRSKGLLSRTR